MSDTASKFVGDIPKNYNAFLGPNIFDRYGREMAAHVAAATPGKVLELAAGSGIVTRHVRDALPGDVAITASDLNAPMLEVAQAKFAANEKVVFTTADAQSLPFDETASTLYFAIGVMFFPDRVGSYRQAPRVIRPGGRISGLVVAAVHHDACRITPRCSAKLQTPPMAEVHPGDPLAGIHSH